MVERRRNAYASGAAKHIPLFIGGVIVFMGLLWLAVTANSPSIYLLLVLLTLTAGTLAIVLPQKFQTLTRKNYELSVRLDASEDKIRHLGVIVSYTNTAVAVTDGKCRITWVNEKFTTITGYSLLEVEGLEIPDVIIGPDTSSKTVETIRSCIHQGKPFQGDLIAYIRSSEKFWANMDIKPVPDRSGNINAFLVVIHEITKRKAKEQQLARQALHDVLTGLCNRQMFGIKLSNAVDEYHRSGQAFAVLFLDLDGFKPINDTHGHDAGDKVLIIIAERLKKCVRGHDTVARLGGDEFTILLEKLQSPADAVHTANRLLSAIGTPIELGGGTIVKVSASIGLVYGSAEHHRSDDLLDAADRTMYKAKKAGKGRIIIYHPPAQATDQPEA